MARTGHTSTLARRSDALVLGPAAHGELDRLGVQAPERLLETRPELPAVADLAARVAARVRGPSGMALVRAAELAPRVQRLAFAALGLAIAEPILRYGLLYAVHDRGGSYRESAIPVSKTRAATGFHTDSSAWNCVPGVVALLCERPSPAGGASRVTHAERACAWLAERDPAALAQLRRSYVRDVVTPGAERTAAALRRNRFPVVALEPDFQLRYMRYWIEKGHERAGEPLDADALRAFDALDAALARPAWSARFRLEAGDMLFLDNRRLAHGREAYADSPGDGRLLWRLWLDERART
ncbi:MAG: TauD/TfdA family dioxygenase [Planctomycetota bacterium]